MAVIEWDQRELCPDGGCVGVIGDGGTCSVCGRAAPGGGAERRREVAPEDTAADPAPGVDDGVDDGGGDDGEGDDGDDDDLAPPAWTQRELCADGACTGVVGDDGRCRVCGKEPG